MDKDTEDALKRNIMGGKFDRNKEDVTLVNNTTKTQDLTVPAGKEWTVLGGSTYNGDDVARNCAVEIYDVANVLVATLHGDAALAATTAITFPRANQAGAENPLLAMPLVMEAGDYARFTFTAGGASAGGTGRITLDTLKRDAV